MVPPVRFLSEHGGMLLLGVTALLGAGAVSMRLQRGPLHRQRLGEFTVACTLLWLALACLPLPRLLNAETPAEPLGEAPRLAPSYLVVPARRLPAPATAPASPLLLASDTEADPLPGATLRDLLDRAAANPAVRLPDAPPAAANAAWKPPALGDVLAVLFVCGAAACAAWLAVGYFLVHRLVRAAAPAPAWLQRLFVTLDASANGARLLVSADCRRPVSCGVFCPAILLPADSVFPENAAQLRQVLLHELGHVRQRDARGNLLFNLALPLLYFHPLYWLAWREVHLARELIADDWAAARSDKARYVSELVALARSALARGGAGEAGPWGSLALFRSPTHFYRRMQMLIQRHEPLETSCSNTFRFGTTAACALALAFAAGTVGVRPARAQEAAPGASNVGTDVSPAAPATSSSAANNAAVDTTPAERAPVNPGSASISREIGVSVRGQADPFAGNNATSDARVLELKKQLERTQDQLKSAMDQLQTVQKFAQEQRVAAERRERAVSDQFAKMMAERNELAGRANRTAPEAGQPSAPASGQKLDDIKLGRFDRADSGATGAGNNPFEGSGLKIGGQIDLVSLAVSYVDAVGGVQTARAQLDRTSKLAQEAGASSSEVDLHKAAYRTAERKLQLLRNFIEIAIQGARTDYDYASRMASQGMISQSQLAEAKQKVQLLELILQSGQESNPAGRESNPAARR